MTTKSVPEGAWDTHHHIFEPARFPFAQGRHFTPSTATLDQLRAFEAAIGVDHVCIAHGLSYGADCSSLLYYLAQFGGRARGICVIDEATVEDHQLDAYHDAGVRSVRLDFFRGGAMHDLDRQVAMIRAAAERLARWDSTGEKKWSVQIQQPHLEHWGRLREVARDLPLPLVVDHMALARAPSMAAPGSSPAVETPGWQDLLGALRDGNVWIKISAPYRCSRDEPRYDDLEPVVTQLVRANPKRVVWGSDWPHTQRHEDRKGARGVEDEEPFLQVDNKAWIESLGRWLTDEEWQDMWVNNPRTLYDYP
ncbi:hypothetical protein VTK73DRAFT_9985 [Phialemonium thermophilum]|uniref:Amidohydrolase-related domain-containing protein n=1 Tax=Phialemonium thermophilum TaxID=223376 RepID=A0ABR3VZ12_9PEZI